MLKKAFIHQRQEQRKAANTPGVDIWSRYLVAGELSRVLLQVGSGSDRFRVTIDLCLGFIFGSGKGGTNV